MVMETVMAMSILLHPVAAVAMSILLHPAVAIAVARVGVVRNRLQKLQAIVTSVT